ncbi:MAG: imidazole glycerol phosphate synthase subunit HisF [Desulfitobacteriia bacterium]|jgi:cyclase
MAKRIIPCLDIQEGRVVVGTNFINLKDAGDPVELAELYEKEGADEIAFLNISSSSSGQEALRDIIRKAGRKISIPIIVGGGIQTLKDMENMIEAGAKKVSINTAAVKNPNLIKEGAQKFGSQSIVAAIDVRRVEESWEVYINGGSKGTGMEVLEWAKRVEDLGAGAILLTSVDRDGTKNGYDNELNRRVSQTVSIPIIASGGAGNLTHLLEGFTLGGVEAVLAASIFHYRKYSIKEAKDYLRKKGIPVETR